MAGISKRIRGSWVSSDYDIMKTDTDTITTLPAVLYPTGTTATVGLKGQTIQSSIPSPTSPVMPQGTGERTGNLIDVANLSGVRWATQYPALLAAINSLPNGVYTMSISYELTSRNDVTDNSVCGWYIAKGSSTLSNNRHNSWYTAPIGTVHTVSGTFTINDNNRGSLNALYLYGCGADSYGATGTANVSNIMLNTGSEALPYEPYGIKIPISCGGATPPVYLGEVETTRKVKKLVFKGDETENWGYSSSGNNARVYLVVDSMAESPSISTHYKFEAIRPYPNLNEYCINSASSLVIGVNINSITSAADFKTYLQQQYANGTPVTVWYVLATEETGIVNEPLMRIGDYADTVSNVSIPVTTGANRISVGTTVQPSEVTVNYHGWHPAVVHEHTNGSWT